MRAEIKPELTAAECISLAGADVLPLTSSALYWPDERILIVADLHLEKGSSFARRGVFLPPYDTLATLHRLLQVLTRYQPRMVVALGDSFHDRDGHRRLSGEAAALLADCQDGREWIWVSGNHDPTPPVGMGGQAVGELALGTVILRHEPQSGAVGEIAGHLHPVGKVRGYGRALRRPCFAAGARRLILPAFGSFTGGLNVLDPAFHELFDGDLEAWLAGEDAVYRVASGQLVPD